MNFNEKREQLLKQAYDVKDIREFDSSYTREFFKLVEEVILYLLEGDDLFFGQFMLKIKRNIRIDITYPIATIPKRDGFNMFFNPVLFLQCDKDEMVALFKHEIYHIMYSHFEREKKMKYSLNKKSINIALDISINQYIKNLPSWSKKINAINMEYNLMLKGDRSAEEYGEEIYKSIKSRIKEPKITDNKDELYNEINLENAHDIWEEIDISEEEIKSLTKKTAISIGDKDTPGNFQKIILGYKERAEIPWQLVLRNILPSLRSGYKKTVMRRDRRQQDRLDLRGRLPNNEAELIVAIDISASMKEEELHKILIEILSISRNTKNKITIIECDDNIERVYKLRGEKDIKKRSHNNGATAFTPVFKYILENNLRNAVLIYFTDGVGEKELSIKPINKKIVWVLTGNEEFSLNNPYGQVKRIYKEKEEVHEGNIGLQMVNEVIHEWAR
ncbi:VWA-like domain-containing protein [Clostridium uliginosum]|uniref:Predicted metal-dependent peptidase n=1 Tax=Clostridium uliginosum TaxID=119641 RepID=A0A1I1Q919_9CLOT|nr:VWA-like domain-containing protein [Clostridium uliginosum]SFD15713.1 Predicted metal-dependent peptidase [Clostridium uliginosum]